MCRYLIFIFRAVSERVNTKIKNKITQKLNCLVSRTRGVGTVLGRVCLKIARRRSREQLFVYCLASQVFVTEKKQEKWLHFCRELPLPWKNLCNLDGY